jgi:small subunit ribosomal protein S16
LAVKIRLKKMGSKKRPFYRLIAADSRSPRDGRFLDNLGHYNPMVEPAEIKIDEDKVYKWLGNGALPTESAANLLKAEGILERWELFKTGLTVVEVNAKIEERRLKQPKAQPKDQAKLSKKAVAAAKATEEAAAKAAEEEAKPAEAPEAPAEEAAAPAEAPEAPAEEAAAPAEESGEEEKS